MANKKQNSEPKRLFLVLCPGESNRFYTTFVEADTIAKDLCEQTDECVDILEVVKSWLVLPPENPEPETNEIELSSLLSE